MHTLKELLTPVKPCCKRYGYIFISQFLLGACQSYKILLFGIHHQRKLCGWLGAAVLAGFYNKMK